MQIFSQQIKIGRTVLIHALCWGIIAFLPNLIFTASDTPYLYLWRVLRSLGLPFSYILVFYVNYFWLVPKFWFRDRKPQFFVANFFVIAVALSIMTGWWQFITDIDHSPFPMRPHPRGVFAPRWPMLVHGWLMLSLIICLAILLHMTQRWQRLVRERKEAENARNEATLANLRNQLNPHFLLNTLNNIYALVAIDQDKAQGAIAELSKLLRHLLYENKTNFVPLHTEMAFITNYINLMKIRVTSAVNIETRIDVRPDDSTPIAPMIFISLIENAFKHGISKNGEGHINIHIYTEADAVHCNISNSNHPKAATDKSGSGIGLQLVIKRLELIYPGAYQWDKGITQNGQEYYSHISIFTNSQQGNRL